MQAKLMERYSNISGNSPITHFRVETTRIIVWFNGGKSYSYSHAKAGEYHVEQIVAGG